MCTCINGAVSDSNRLAHDQGHGTMQCNGKTSSWKIWTVIFYPPHIFWIVIKKRVNADFSFKNPNHQIFPWDGLNSAWTWSWANFCAAYRCNDDLGSLGLAIKTLLPLSTAQCALHKSPMKHKVDIKQIAQWTAQVSRDRVFVQFEMHKFVQLGVNCTRTHRSRELCSGADNMMSTLCTW